MGCGTVIHPRSCYEIDIHKFSIGHVVGRGEYGVVKSGIYLPKNLPVAIKKLPFSKILSHKSGFTTPLLELKILKLTHSHPNIINLRFAFHDSHSCYFVFDCMKGGDLRYHLRNNVKFTEYGVAYLIGCVGSALHFLHSKNIIHRDIKPENVLLNSSGRPFLTDFGISYIDSEHVIPISTSSSGTRCYSAPEVLTNNHKHSYQADYWSLGVLAYELIFNERPFLDLCPSHIIQFVELQYQSMWNDLEIQNSTSNYEIDWNYFQNLPIQQSSFGSSELYMIELRNRQFMLSSSSSSSSSKYSITQDLSPDTYLHQLPPSYCIQIPRYTVSELAISESCRDFLSKLLDIRIPNRLGTRSTLLYDEVLEHEWFVDNYITKEKIMYGTLFPDFLPNELQISSQVFMEFPENLFSSDLFPVENAPVKLSKEIKQQLQDFYYISPIMMHTDSNMEKSVNIKSSTQLNIPFAPGSRQSSFLSRQEYLHSAHSAKIYNLVSFEEDERMTSNRKGLSSEVLAPRDNLNNRSTNGMGLSSEVPAPTDNLNNRSTNGMSVSLS